MTYTPEDVDRIAKVDEERALRILEEDEQLAAAWSKGFLAKGEQIRKRNSRIKAAVLIPAYLVLLWFLFFSPWRIF